MKTNIDPRKIYQDTSIRGATPIELVVTLYNSVIEDMQRAMQAMQHTDVEARASQVGHALLVLQQLQGTLNFEQGGQAAKQFEQFYNLIRAKLLEAQMRASPDLIQQQIRFMSEVRDCWIQAERQFHPSQNASATAGGMGEHGGQDSGWNA